MKIIVYTGSEARLVRRAVERRQRRTFVVEWPEVDPNPWSCVEPRTAVKIEAELDALAGRLAAHHQSNPDDPVWNNLVICTVHNVPIVWAQKQARQGKAEVVVYYVGRDGPCDFTARQFDLDVNGDFIGPWPDDWFEIEFYLRFD